jgi:hypothetical protein
LYSSVKALVGEKELFELQTKQAKKRIKLRASD